MAQGMHADITNILVSKRLDKWRRVKKILHSSETFNFKPPRKRMAKLKISTNFPHIFSKFSSNFLQLFQMTKLYCFQHRSTNVCKNTVKVKAAFCSTEFLLCHKCVIFWLHGFCVNQHCTRCGNVLETSHIWHLVCVCVRTNFSAICLPRCLWDMGISKHKRRNATTRPVHLNSAGLFMQKQRVRRWNGAIFSCSTKASNSFTQNARQIETGRSGKREAKKWLYKIQPLRQQKPIGTVFVIVARFGAHLALFYPTAILQREGFWQHKGLGKHNAISVASSILTCNGLATQKRLASWR